MMRRSTWWVLALMASCQSTAPTDGGGGNAHDAGADVMCRSADEFAQSHEPNDLCAVDSDCHNAFLACAAQDVFICRDPSVGNEDAGCPSPIPANAPICPTTAQVSIHMCAVRYQLPCHADADCGPGYACVGQQCQGPEASSCTTVADCPAQWECYDPCPCGDAAGQKRCYAPFARFSCPFCGVVTPDDAGADGPMTAD
jgi:hypothetical protein